MVGPAAPVKATFGHASAKIGFNPALDGLRALSVAGVVGLHGGYAATGGAQGVTVFFVISGYLITSLLLAEFAADGRIRFGHFYRRRLARLAPALVVVAVVTVAWLLVTRAPVAGWILGAIGGLTYTTDLLSAYFGNTGVGESFQYTWSLGIEEQFYLFWPLILFLLLRLGRLYPAIAFLVLGIGATWVYRYLAVLGKDSQAAFAFGPFTHTDALLLGCGIGIVLTCFPTSIVLRRISQVAGPLGVAVLAVIFIRGFLFSSIDQFGLAALAAAAVVAWVALVPNGWFGRILSFAPLAFLGRLSYGIYLWNIFLLLVFTQIFSVPPAQTWWGLAWIAAIVVVAYLSYRFVERPLRKRWAPQQAHAVLAAPVAGPTPAEARDPETASNRTGSP